MSPDEVTPSEHPSGWRSVLSSRYVQWSLVAILLHILPVAYLGRRAYVRIHDTLEGEWHWLELLSRTHRVWSMGQTVPEIMNGLPRDAMPSPFNLAFGAIALGGPYWGYFLWRFALMAFGFFGMRRLLRRRVFGNRDPEFIATLIAMTFASTPFYPTFGASIMGIPWLILGLQEAFEGRATWKTFVLFATFALYASLVWAGVPVTLGLGCYWVFLEVDHHRRNLAAPRTMLQRAKVGLLFVVFLVGFQLANAPFLGAAKHMTSQRDAYNLYPAGLPTFGKLVGDAAMTFFVGHYHSGIFITAIVMLTFFFARKVATREARLLAGAFAAIVLVQGTYPLIEALLSKVAPSIAAVRFNRLQVWIAPVCLIAFAWLVRQLVNASRSLARLVPHLLLAQLVVTMVSNDETAQNWRFIFGQPTQPSYAEYYSRDLFAKVTQELGNPAGYRVVSLGMSPSIAQSNGFFALDSLQSMYPLAYKNDFRRIIGGELAKDAEIRDYFDGWGNRCYVFSSELGTSHRAFMQSKFGSHRINALTFNAAAFASMGGRYVFSAVEIAHPEGLRLVKRFDDANSWWSLFVYEVDLTHG